VVAAGDEGYPMAEMLAPLLEGALHWIEIGLPLDRIKVVTHLNAQAQEALRVFSEKKAEYLRPAPESEPQQMDYDVFISYGRANARESEALEQALRDQNLNISAANWRGDLPNRFWLDPETGDAWPLDD